jgi:hypothetical protein
MTDNDLDGAFKKKDNDLDEAPFTAHVTTLQI